MKAMIQKQARRAAGLSFASIRAELLQRKCAWGGTSHPTGECEECREERLQHEIRNPNSEIRDEPRVPSIVAEELRSPGQPLDSNTRAFMEPRAGHNFSKVRVHTGERAAESAEAVNALAYTVGNDIVFGGGQYAPNTPRGQDLIAHEF